MPNKRPILLLNGALVRHRKLSVNIQSGILQYVGYDGIYHLMAIDRFAYRKSDSGREIVEINAAGADHTTYYVRAVELGAFRIVAEPGGPALGIISSP